MKTIALMLFASVAYAADLGSPVPMPKDEPIAVSATPERSYGRLLSRETFDLGGKTVAVEEYTSGRPAQEAKAKPAAKAKAAGCVNCGPGCECGPNCKCDATGYDPWCAKVPANVRAEWLAKYQPKARATGNQFDGEGYWLEGGFGPPPVPDGYTMRMEGNVVYLDKTQSQTARSVPQRPFGQAAPTTIRTTPAIGVAGRSSWSNGSYPTGSTSINAFVGIPGGTSGCASGG